MPHQCTDCGRVFDDGSTEMLSGCPDCGGNKFQFHPDTDDVPEQPSPDAEPPDRPQPGGESSVAQKVGSAATTVRDLVGSSPSGPPEPTSTDAPATSEPSTASADATDATVTAGDAASADTEDAAQASARSELVSPDELPAAPDRPATTRSSPAVDPSPNGSTSAPEEATPGDTEPREERPDLSELRAELNDQFESIKVLEPGQYELNLMSLYDREEYIIALQEDGKYTIQVPERWQDEE
jgi:predicted  nucleic acid-binding Zn-ribbon protein